VTKLSHDEAQKRRAVQVGHVAAWKQPRLIGHLIEPQELALEDVAAQIHVKQRRAEPTSTRALRLFQHRQPFDEPARLHLIGRVDVVDPQAEQQVHPLGQPRHRIEVQDVGVLVDKQRIQPVVEVVQLRAIIRRSQKQPHRRKRHRRRRSVRVIGVIAQDDLGAKAGRVTHHRRQHAM
jgi:hypothetical protein